jgi:hypothetical protein
MRNEIWNGQKTQTTHSKELETPNVLYYPHTLKHISSFHFASTLWLED